MIAAMFGQEAIDGILLDPSLVDQIGYDGSPAGFINHPLHHYFGAYVECELVGIFHVVIVTDWEIDAHIAILPGAMRHGRALAREFTALMFESTTIMRITAQVLSPLLTAANFCRKLGFVDEGHRRHVCKRGDEVLDVIILGLTREDWEAAR